MRSAEKILVPAPITKIAAPVSPPSPDPKAELLTRFPPLVNEAQAAIRGDEAQWLHAHGALFLDARRTALYMDGHIPSAKNFSAWEDGLPEKVDQLSLFTADLKLPVVIYCSGGDCHDSHLVAQKLWLAGFRNLRIYTDGYPDWEARKLAVIKGEKP
jgi:rhodanese-related sulfurtransferase